MFAIKKVCCLFLATILILSLAACSTPQPDANTSTGDTTEGATSGEASQPTETSGGETQPQQTEPTEPPVRTLYCCIEEKYTTSDGSGVTTRTFDEKGNLLSEDYKSQSGAVAYGDSYTYDEKGNVLTHKTYDQHEQLSTQTVSTYNEAGQLISQLFTTSESYVVKSDYFYADDGLLVKKVDSYPDTPNSEFHYVYTYDEKGNLIKEDWINVNDGVQTPHSWKAWTYDAKGNKLSETDNQGAKTEWTYDDRGNLLSEAQYFADGSYWMGTACTYDQENRLLTEAFSKGDPSQIMEAFIYEYDDNGNEIARYRCYDAVDKANAVRVFKSSYDENGNKISEICCTPEGEETTWREYKYIAIELPNE